MNEDNEIEYKRYFHEKRIWHIKCNVDEMLRPWCLIGLIMLIGFRIIKYIIIN